MGIRGGAEGLGRTGLRPPLLCTLEPMLDVSGDANRGAVPEVVAAPVTATADDDKLSGSVFLTGDRAKRDFSLP